MTNDAGVVQGLAHYDAWGVLASGSVALAPFGFTGELQQGGDVYLRARWYNAARGSFGSRDPYAGDDTTPYSLHAYQYGYANPVSNTDPTGWCAQAGQGDDYCVDDATDSFLNDFVRLAQHDLTILARNRAKQLPIAQTNVVTNQRNGDIAASCIWSTIEGLEQLDRLIAFALLVREGGPADIKGYYQGRFGNNLTLFDRPDRRWRWDITGNLMYGYLGRLVGLESDVLRTMGGVVQYIQHCLAKHEPDEVGPGALNCDIVMLRVKVIRMTSALVVPFITNPSEWDDPIDQAAINAGIDLSGLTP